EVVLDGDAEDRARLVLNEEPLATVVVQVVAPEDEVVTDPHRLQAVRVVAVLTHAGDLVAFDQNTDPVAVAVVVPVEVDRVLAEGSDELVADDLNVVHRDGRRRRGFDPEVAAADAVVGDSHRARGRLDLDFTVDVEAFEGEVAPGHGRAGDRRRAGVLGPQRHPAARRGREISLAVAAVSKADDRTRARSADLVDRSGEGGDRVGAGEWARLLFGLLTTTRGATRILDCGAATWAGPTAACPPPPARLVLASRRRAGSLRVASLYLAAKCWEICVAVRAWL